MYGVATVLAVAIAIIIWRCHVTIETLCHLDSPRCYSVDFCESIQDIRLRYDSITDFINMFLATKNTYQAWYNGSKVILKQLSHDNSTYNLKTCTDNDSEVIYSQINERFDLITEINEYNPEPFILELFKGDWPVPHLVGMCGMLLVETDRGTPLLDHASSPWPIRAELAAQLIESALRFTHDHAYFRLYLTDISGDNVVVDADNRISFVDLEHVILTVNKDGALHQSEFYQDDFGFAYADSEICKTGYSDHNVYAICYLLLWKHAPWPFAGGLLYDAGGKIEEAVERCVKMPNRFESVKELLALLRRHF